MWKALLVDDEESIRKLLTTVLEMKDFSVQASDSARNSITILQSDSYDVVITDLRMETPLAGYYVTRAAARVSPRPLIVIVTAFPVPASEWRSAGADALFTKGANTLNLASHLVEMLVSRHATHDSATPAHRPESFLRRGFS
jgi:CheY-like chemotaxis protein